MNTDASDSMEHRTKHLYDLFSKLEKYFSPKVVGEVNDAYVKIAKVKGPDVPWHTTMRMSCFSFSRETLRCRSRMRKQ